MIIKKLHRELGVEISQGDTVFPKLTLWNIRIKKSYSTFGIRVPESYYPRPSKVSIFPTIIKIPGYLRIYMYNTLGNIINNYILSTEYKIEYEDRFTELINLSWVWLLDK